MNGLPEVIAQRSDDTRREIDIFVATDNPWFNGHFPKQPILPGVVQIGWAVHFANTTCGLGPAIQNMEQIKFRRPIMPGAQLTLRLTPNEDRSKVRYEFRDAEHSYSSGVLNFGTAA